MRSYFRNLYRSVYTVLIGMRITLRYYFASPITRQYPDAPPTLQPRFRGFHYFEIEKCIGCDMCAKACPVDCIYIEKSGPRKIDKATGIARGGALERFAIDFSKCMFCALCIEPCPTECIHMGDVHDMSAFDRRSMVVEYTELARKGLQTPQPLWMQRSDLPAWAVHAKRKWIERGQPLREEMLRALVETEVAKPKKAPAAPGAGAAPAAPGAQTAPAAAGSTDKSGSSDRS